MIFSQPWPASSFQCLEVMFGTPSSVTRLLLVYRPPSTSRRGISFRTFMAEFTNLLECFTAQLTGLIILGDFNIHYGKAGNKDSNDFSDILHAANLRQHVRNPTHTIGNILDLVITPSSGSAVTSVTVGSLLTDHHVVTSVTVGFLLTDHHAVHCLLQAPKPDRMKKQISYRKYAAIISTKFISKFELSYLVTSPCNNIADLSQQYDSTLKGLLNTQQSNFASTQTTTTCWILSSAYRQHHSTETALVRTQNDHLHSLDRRKGELAVLLDMSAAFDTVDHSMLISQLRSIGIQGTALKWLESYMSNKTQTVCIGGHYSQKTLNESGIPQGSVLGPILFSIYTLPLGAIFRKHNLQYHLYADDT